MTKPDNLIFFGAGASKAANPNMPLVCDFFKQSGLLIKSELDNHVPLQQILQNSGPLWKFLRYIEDLRSDSFINPIGINATYNSLKYGNIWGDGAFLPEISTALNIITVPDGRPERQVFDALRSCTNYLTDYRPSKINIEHIIIRIENYSYTSKQETPRELMRDFITWLFAKLEAGDALNCANTPHKNLVAQLNSKGLLDRTILVSFNYDVILERSLKALDVGHLPPWWNSISGYGFDAAGYYSMKHGKFIDGVVKKELGKICLLKPHGSLAWVTNKHQIFPVVDDRDKYGGRPIIPTGAELSHVHGQKDCSSIIIPPGRIKRLYGKHSWQTWKTLGNALQHCKKVIVIGWNIPETDIDVKDRLIREIDKREEDNQIEKLIVCDKDMPDVFYDKFSMLFLPQQPVRKLNEGFTDHSVDKIIEYILN